MQILFNLNVSRWIGTRILFASHFIQAPFEVQLFVCVCAGKKGERYNIWWTKRVDTCSCHTLEREREIAHKQPHGIFAHFQFDLLSIFVPVYSFDVCISKLEVNVKQIFGNQKSKRCLNRWDDKVQTNKNERSELQRLIARSCEPGKWAKLKGGGVEGWAIGGWRMKWKSKIWRNEPFFRFNLLASKCGCYLICDLPYKS